MVGRSEDLDSVPRAIRLKLESEISILQLDHIHCRKIYLRGQSSFRGDQGKAEAGEGLNVGHVSGVGKKGCRQRKQRLRRLGEQMESDG